MRLLHPVQDAAPDLEALYDHPPGVRLGMVGSVDGAVGLGGRSGGLSGPPDRQVFRLLRSLADVVLVGAGTARAEDYRPVRLPPEQQERRVARGQLPLPPVAVVTRGRGLDRSSPLLLPGSGLVLLTSRQGATSSPPGVDVAVVGEASVDLPTALAALAARGLERVLCEGGPALNGALLDARLVDELCVSTSPVLAGGAAPRLVGGAGEAALPLELASLLEQDGMLLARWRVRPG